MGQWHVRDARAGPVGEHRRLRGANRLGRRTVDDRAPAQQLRGRRQRQQPVESRTDRRDIAVGQPRVRGADRRARGSRRCDTRPSVDGARRSAGRHVSRDGLGADPRPRGMDPGRLDHRARHSPSAPTGWESCDSELLPGPRSCCGGSGPRPARASPRRSSSTRGTRCPRPVSVTVVWGLEPAGSPHGIPWFDHPVVPSGTPTSVRIPARGNVLVALAGNGFGPAGPYHLRVAMQTDRATPLRPASTDASLSYPHRRSRRGRHVVDRIEGGRAHDGRVGARAGAGGTTRSHVDRRHDHAAYRRADDRRRRGAQHRSAAGTRFGLRDFWAARARPSRGRTPPAGSLRARSLRSRPGRPCASD